MRSQIEIDQRIDWLSSQFYKLQERVEKLERERLTTAVSLTYGTVTKDPQTGELL